MSGVVLMDGKGGKRAPGQVQRFADRAGGPSGMAGDEYQVLASCHEALTLISRSQSSPFATMSLRCESRVLVGRGQLGFDLGVVTPEGDKQVEAKSAPLVAEVVELLARLPVLAAQGRSIQLVHAKETAWTDALAELVRNAGEAVDDDELLKIVKASANAKRQELLEAVPTAEPGRKGLLASMEPPNLLPFGALRKVLLLQAGLLAGDRAERLLQRLTGILRDAFQTRRTWDVGDLHRMLITERLVTVVAVVALPSDSPMLRAIAVLDACAAPLPEAVLDKALRVEPGATRAALKDLVDAHQVHAANGALWRPSGGAPIPAEVTGDALVRTLTVLLDTPPAGHSEKIEQVPNVLALALACAVDAPEVVARAFHPYDKAAKATGDFSCVYRLAKTAIRAAEIAGARPGLDPADQTRFLWLRGHARICGTSWTLQRVEQIDEATAQMTRARTESIDGSAKDNLAFVDKCQGRLSRLRAEELTASGFPAEAEHCYDLSRSELAAAYLQFTELVAAPEFAKYAEEPGECLALRARTELSQFRLDDAAGYAERAHAELDHLESNRKAFADVCLVDAEIALARVRAGMETCAARKLLSDRKRQLEQVVEQFSGGATIPVAADVSASEIVARALQVLGQLAREVGDDEVATDLWDRAALQFDRLGQIRVAWRCQASALDLRGDLPIELAIALAASDASEGCRVETARLHYADPKAQAPDRHWQSLVDKGRLIAISRDHVWTDRLTG